MAVFGTVMINEHGTLLLFRLRRAIRTAAIHRRTALAASALDGRRGGSEQRN